MTATIVADGGTVFRDFSQDLAKSLAGYTLSFQSSIGVVDISLMVPSVVDFLVLASMCGSSIVCIWHLRKNKRLGGGNRCCNNGCCECACYRTHV